MSPDGLALNSKWNEAEKYICNPLSGEVPLECLSAKTLSGRSFRQFTNKITMSAPLIYPSQYQITRQFHRKPPTKVVPHLSPHELKIQIPSKGTHLFSFHFVISTDRVKCLFNFQVTNLTSLVQLALQEMWEHRAVHQEIT